MGSLSQSVLITNPIIAAIVFIKEIIEFGNYGNTYEMSNSIYTYEQWLVWMLVMFVIIEQTRFYH